MIVFCTIAIIFLAISHCNCFLFSWFGAIKIWPGKVHFGFCTPLDTRITTNRLIITLYGIIMTSQRSLYPRVFFDTCCRGNSRIPRLHLPVTLGVNYAARAACYFVTPVTAWGFGPLRKGGSRNK